MEKYITESLAAGVIRPSSSPVAAGFFFVEKKAQARKWANLPQICQFLPLSYQRFQ